MDAFISSSSTQEKPHTENRVRVMLVDDHELLLYGLRNILNDIDGFSVVAGASCYKDAIAKLERLAVDLVLLALPLPDCDKPEVIYQLKEILPSLKVIIISALMDDDLLLKALLAGASGYLTKDISASEMVRCLQSLKRGELALASASMSKAINLLVQQCRAQQAELNHHAGNGTKQNGLKPSEQLLPLTVDAASHLLTPQEEKVYQLMRQGQSNKQIAAQLAISPYTVGKHVQNILRKLGATNRTQAASYTSF